MADETAPTQPSEDLARRIEKALRHQRDSALYRSDADLIRELAALHKTALDRLTHLEGRGEAQGDELKKACLGLVQAIRHMGREREVLDECWYAVDWAEAVIDGRDPGAAVIGDDPAPSLEGQHGEKGLHIVECDECGHAIRVSPATAEAGGARVQDWLGDAEYEARNPTTKDTGGRAGA